MWTKKQRGYNTIKSTRNIFILKKENEGIKDSNRDRYQEYF